METAIIIIVGVGILFGIMYMLGWAFQQDLDDMEKSQPEYRKYLKDKYGW